MGCRRCAFQVWVVSMSVAERSGPAVRPRWNVEDATEWAVHTGKKLGFYKVAALPRLVGARARWTPSSGLPRDSEIRGFMKPRQGDDGRQLRHSRVSRRRAGPFSEDLFAGPGRFGPDSRGPPRMRSTCSYYHWKERRVQPSSSSSSRQRSCVPLSTMIARQSSRPGWARVCDVAGAALMAEVFCHLRHSLVLRAAIPWSATDSWVAGSRMRSMVGLGRPAQGSQDANPRVSAVDVMSALGLAVQVIAGGGSTQWSGCHRRHRVGEGPMMTRSSASSGIRWPMMTGPFSPRLVDKSPEPSMSIYIGEKARVDSGGLPRHPTSEVRDSRASVILEMQRRCNDARTPARR